LGIDGGYTQQLTNVFVGKRIYTLDERGLRKPFSIGAPSANAGAFSLAGMVGLAAIDATLGKNKEYVARNYRELVERVALGIKSRLAGSRDSLGFFQEFSRQLKEEETGKIDFVLEMKIAGSTGMLSVLAYDVGNLLGIDMELTFFNNRQIAKAGNLVLVPETLTVRLVSVEEKRSFFHSDIDRLQYLAYAYTGDERYVEGDYADALALYKKGAACDPENPKAYNAIGVAYIALNAPHKALAPYAKALALATDRNVPALDLAVYHYNIAYTRFKTGDLEQKFRAIGDCTDSIELNPKYADAYLLRSWLYEYVGKDSKSKEDLLHYEKLTGSKENGNP